MNFPRMVQNNHRCYCDIDFMIQAHKTVYFVFLCWIETFGKKQLFLFISNMYLSDFDIAPLLVLEQNGDILILPDKHAIE